jgi:hypothetical protein
MLWTFIRIKGALHFVRFTTDSIHIGDSATFGGYLRLIIRNGILALLIVGSQASVMNRAVKAKSSLNEFYAQSNTPW